MSVLATYYRQTSFGRGLPVKNRDSTYVAIPVVTVTYVQLFSFSLHFLISNTSIVETAVGVMIPCMAACAKVVNRTRLFRSRRNTSSGSSEFSDGRAIGAEVREKPHLVTIDRMLGQFQPSDRDDDSGFASGNISRTSNVEV